MRDWKVSWRPSSTPPPPSITAGSRRRNSAAASGSPTTKSRVAAWLEQKGLTIDEIGQGRGWINVSGPVSRVESAFGTRIHTFSNAEGERPVRVDSLTMPREISGLVAGLASLGSASRRPMSHRTSAARSLAYGGGSADRALAPEDFATIYGVAPLHAAGVTAAGVTIAIAGRTEISVADVSAFRKLFGLPANDPVLVRNGPSPGNLGGYEEFEADLDVEWSGAIAPNAAVKLVVSGSTAATDGIDLSAQYIVDQNLAPIVSVSFGNCEAEMGTAASALYKNLWAQAAAQGMTVFVASMDSGASACSTADDSEGSGRAVSGLCTTPNDVCVGGTQFDDHGDPGRYWADSSDARLGSALSYIPEAAWNESGKTPGGSGLWSTGGGTSTLFRSRPGNRGFPASPPAAGDRCRTSRSRRPGAFRTSSSRARPPLRPASPERRERPSRRLRWRGSWR